MTNANWWKLHVALLAMLGGAIAVGACARLHMGSRGEPALIIFSNESMDEATVYVVAPGGASQRLGRVTGGRTDTLRIQPDLLESGGTLNIVALVAARPIRPETGPVTIESGGSYRVSLGAHERALSFLFRP